MNYKRGFVPLVLIIIIVVAVIGGGAYIATKNKAEVKQEKKEEKTNVEATASINTAGWKTYTNTKYDFQLLYPSSWQINSTFTTDNSIIFKHTVNKNDVSINIENPIKNYKGNTVTLDEYLKDYNYDLNYIKENKTINGNIFLRFEGIEKVNSVRYIIVKNNTKYEFVLNNKNLLPLFEKMVASFEFTSSSATTKDWKTYTNTQYGFEFKYPAGWYVQGNIPDTNSRSDESYTLDVTNYKSPWPEPLPSDFVKIQVQVIPNSSRSMQEDASMANELTGIIPKVKKVTINGIPGLKNNSIGSGIYYLPLPNSSKGFLRVIVFASGDWRQTISEQILTSFKFTN